MAPKIIAAAKADESTGAVVYWTMSGAVPAGALAAAWAAAGLDAEWLPKPASARDALRRVCNDLRSDKVLVRKHKAGGWVLVTESWDAAAAKPVYDVGTRFWIEDDRVRADGESPHTAAIQAAFDAAMAAIATQDFSAWVVRIFGGRLHAVLLRETGGIYFVPQAAMGQFAACKAAIAAASAHIIYEIPAVNSAEAAAAVFAAVQREVAEEIAALEVDLANETIRGTTVLDRLAHCNEVGAKVGVYERLFGQACGGSMTELRTVAARLRALAEVRDRDACDVFAKLEIEIAPALPPGLAALPVVESFTPAPGMEWSPGSRHKQAAARAAAEAAPPAESPAPRDATDVFGKLEVE